MAIERELTKHLHAWKANPAHKALLLDGAHQVGKTFAVRAFGKENYKVFAKLNFVENPGAKAIFDGDLNARDLIMGITAYTGVALQPGKTLIFLDEVQACPRAHGDQVPRGGWALRLHRVRLAAGRHQRACRLAAGGL